MEPRDLELKRTVGLVGGLTIQFAEGRWTGRWEGEIGEGIALEIEAFDLIEPCLRAACPEWTSMHRYGVFELPVKGRPQLAMLLRSEAARIRDLGSGSAKEAALFGTLADWLEARCDGRAISILGI